MPIPSCLFPPAHARAPRRWKEGGGGREIFNWLSVLQRAQARPVEVVGCLSSRRPGGLPPPHLIYSRAHAAR